MSEPYVRPDVRMFLDYLNALPGPRAHEVEPAEARNLMLASRQVADAPVGELAVIRDLSFEGPGGEVRLRLYDAREMRGEGPLMLFFHGGGFVLGDLDSHEPFCAEIARQLDMPVLAVDYRLAPEHPWPAGIEDAIAAAYWAAQSPKKLERQVNGLVVCGDSAGGNFAIIVTLALRDTPAKAPVLALWAIYPAADPGKGYPSFEDFGEGYLLTKPGMRWFEDCYQADTRDWRYNPLVKSQAGMPPTLVITASLDPIRDQGRAYAAACIQAGVPTIFREAKGNIHGFISLRKAIPSSEEDIKGCVAALKLLLGEGRLMTDYGYRPAVGVMLINDARKIWVGQRRDNSLEAWQMPQGGLDKGEQPLEGAYRELEEETGISRHLVELVAQAKEDLTYDLPEDLIGKVWKEPWRGQRQTWFLMRFLGEDKDVNLDTADPEFRAWKWADPAELPVMIVPFKQQLYRDVLLAFAEWL